MVAPSPGSKNVSDTFWGSLSGPHKESFRKVDVDDTLQAFSELSMMSTSWGSLSGPRNEYFR